MKRRKSRFKKITGGHFSWNRESLVVPNDGEGTSTGRIHPLHRHRNSLPTFVRAGVKIINKYERIISTTTSEISYVEAVGAAKPMDELTFMMKGAKDESRSQTKTSLIELTKV
ncbi:hypothetical protein J6590_008781 [Homalodisca vitripennis]|nr:hypothetical protein J6590_008781 [Homalodisca vitripennis]